MDITVDIADFVALVNKDCPGGLEALKQEAVLASAAQFCRETRVWREVFEDLADATDASAFINVNTAIAAVITATDVTVMDIADVWLNDDKTRLSPLSAAVLDVNHPDWRDETAETPVGYVELEDRRIRIYPAIESGADAVALDFELVLLPVPTSEKLPDFLYNIHHDTIVAGAVQRLKTQPGQPWSDPETAKFFFGKARSGIHDSRVEAARRITRHLNSRRRRCFR